MLWLIKHERSLSKFYLTFSTRVCSIQTTLGLNFSLVCTCNPILFLYHQFFLTRGVVEFLLETADISSSFSLTLGSCSLFYSLPSISLISLGLFHQMWVLPNHVRAKIIIRSTLFTATFDCACMTFVLGVRDCMS